MSGCGCSPWARAVTTGVAPAAAPAQEAQPAPPQSGNMNAGSLLVLGVLASGIVMWIHGRARENEERRAAEFVEDGLEDASMRLDGAREDEQIALAREFARGGAMPLRWGP